MKSAEARLPVSDLYPFLVLFSTSKYCGLSLPKNIRAYVCLNVCSSLVMKFSPVMIMKMVMVMVMIIIDAQRQVHWLSCELVLLRPPKENH